MQRFRCPWPTVRSCQREETSNRTSNIRVYRRGKGRRSERTRPMDNTVTNIIVLIAVIAALLVIRRSLVKLQERQRGITDKVLDVQDKSLAMQERSLAIEEETLKVQRETN